MNSPEEQELTAKKSKNGSYTSIQDMMKGEGLSQETIDEFDRLQREPFDDEDESHSSPIDGSSWMEDGLHRAPFEGNTEDDE